MSTVTAQATETNPLAGVYAHIEGALRAYPIPTSNDGRAIIAEALAQLASEAEGRIRQPRPTNRHWWERSDSPRLQRVAAHNKALARRAAVAGDTLHALGAFAQAIEHTTFAIESDRVRFGTLVFAAGGLSVASCRAEGPLKDGSLGPPSSETFPSRRLPDELYHPIIDTTACAVLERALAIYRDEA